MNIAVASIILLLNATFLIVASAKYGFKTGQEGVLYEGSCSKTENLTLTVHLCINILSSLLLSASNYTMQVLASPTRQEVDRAYKNSHCLRIGIQDLRNFQYISSTRILMWSLLVLSSLPLHLM